MDDMRRGLNVEKAEAALKRAAHKAIHGTREERSGRFLPAAKEREPLRRPSGDRDDMKRKG
jgi:hypothetical protein